MKTLRKNIDLSSRVLVVLQIEATIQGHGSLKPFLETIINDYVEKALKAKPEIYKNLKNLGEKNQSVSLKKLLIKKK